MTCAIKRTPGVHAGELRSATHDPASAAGRHHLVAVTPWVFDDAADLVQVTGTTLTPGQHVVVPAI
jgi:hypothetical protein